EWTARKVHLPFYRIDPLKIDFTSVSEVMSATYATRFNILPVELSGNTVVVATTDPYNREWQDEIARISRKDIRLVFANPLDISQYIGQFFSLAKSIKDARKSNGNDLGLRQNLEQLVELG
ncbi:type II/IV secretion system protein, partial [Undibacterium sp. LFS511W]|nr:type II/IV secretion system protein [Undibacterium luofuense]